jgi:hypothetical protein
MTAAIADLITSGRIADLILAIMAIEAAIFGILSRRTGKGPPIGLLIVTMLSGAFLVLALRGALTGAAWPLIAGALTLSMVAHAAFIAVAWRSPR